MTSRSETLQQLVALKRSNTEEYHKYLSKPREYYPGEKMYMREAHVIMAIGPDGLDSLGVLAEQLGVTMGAVSQQLARLEEKGFIKRVQMPQDKRQYSVKLTDKGRKLYDLHKQYDQANYARVLPMFKEFSEQDLEVIMKFEEKFREFIDLANKEVGTDDNY